jgi:hypothetical protein
LLGVGLVEDYGGDLADVGVDGEAEEEELDERNEESEEEGAGVTGDVRARLQESEALAKGLGFLCGGAARCFRVVVLLAGDGVVADERVRPAWYRLTQNGQAEALLRQNCFRQVPRMIHIDAVVDCHEIREQL